MHKVDNNKLHMKKEGFSHKGKSVLVSSKKVESTIKSAEYGYLEPGSWTDVSGFVTNKFKKTSILNVKPILDALINKGTKEIVIANNTFDVVDPAPGKTKFLIIHFKKPDVNISDAAFKFPDYSQFPVASLGGPDRARMYKALTGAYIWMEGASMSLKFANYTPDPFLLKRSEEVYKFADTFAMSVLMYPYTIIRNFTMGTGDTVSYKLPNLFKGIGEAVKKFIKSLFGIVKGIFQKIFGFIKKGFKKLFSILKDIPGFLSDVFNFIIDFIEKVVTKVFNLIGRIFSSVVDIVKAILTLPMMIFDIIEKVLDFIINLIQMIIALPISILNMILAFQGILMDIMKKTPTIPFLDMFFK
jgi:phage-related protein